MAMAKRVPFPRIVRNPNIVGGEPTIKGTRVPVRSIVLTFRFHPDVDYLLDAYPMLDREAVEEALAFYQANHEEIDRHIVENEQD